MNPNNSLFFLFMDWWQCFFNDYPHNVPIKKLLPPLKTNNSGMPEKFFHTLQSPSHWMVKENTLCSLCLCGKGFKPLFYFRFELLPNAMAYTENHL
jgi:hypothetical protein